MDLETLLATCEISQLQFKFSSLITPKKTVSFTGSSSLYPCETEKRLYHRQTISIEILLTR